jgi:two-component system sensor kinase FixL
LDGQLPPVRADVIQIEQVLLNLIRNAIDAMEETDHGQRLLTIRTRVDESGVVCAEICDRGVGLPKDAGDRIFEAFFTTKPHGLGIGLSISRTIMEMHGGTLEARENDGRGCTFVVSFPTVPATE